MRIGYLLLALSIPVATEAQTPPLAPRSSPSAPHATAAQPSPEIQAKVENYLRHLYAWGPTFHVKFGPLKESPIPSLYELDMEISFGDQSDSAVLFVSKDARYLLRGDLQDMTVDPLAAIRAQIRLEDNPSKGPANARVNIVEFGDFQCPSCKALHEVLRELEPRYPQVRIVFKDFPLAQIHPWAMTGAIAGRCAYQQDHAAFWKLFDYIYDNQELISPENVWEKMLDFAGQAGLDSQVFRACMVDPGIKEIINQSVREGTQLKIANTPTVFVNGRRYIAPDRETLEEVIQYELAAQPPGARGPN